jgi:putative transcriptional regulator
MFRVHWKTLVIAVSTLLSPCMTQAVDSDLGMHRHSKIASILRSTQEWAAGSPALNPSMSTQRFLHQISLERGVFLVAKRHINDPRFKQTVILITGHDTWGSIGLVVNRPSEVPVAKLLPEWAGLVAADTHVYYGGPVEINLLRFLIRSSRPLDIGKRVLEDVYVVASKPTFDTFIRNRDPNNVIHAYIGYAGWAVGQLEHEIDRGDWYIVKGDAKTLFESDPDTLWKRFIRALSGSWVYYQH